MTRTPQPGSLGAWILASRPPTLGAAVVPVFVGGACAFAVDGLRWGPVLVALFSAIWIQIGTNFANDVFDYEKGADTEDRLGPTRAVQAGLLTAEQVRRGMWVSFAIAFVGGLYLTWAGGWPLIVIGVASILSGIAYTGGPYPLGYNGLGDVFVMIFFGFVAVCGTVWVSALTLPELAWWASIPPGALATAILVVNNVRDRPTDILVGKRTLAVRFGRGAGIAEYVLLVAASYATPVLLLLRGLAGPWALLPLLTLPLGAAEIRRLTTREGPALNPVLVGTARLLVVFGVLFAAGLTVDAWVGGAGPGGPGG
ncbi:MAG: 1,4-dihydroxy-2-naphthoate polyprenyltransferase [Acidobacteriota bacterium]